MQSYDDTTNSEIYYSFIHLKSNNRIVKYFGLISFDFETNRSLCTCPIFQQKRNVCNEY